jgi:mannosyltransferase
VSRPTTLALIGLTAIAAALRIAGLDQSLFGDELFTYDTVNRPDVGAVLHHVHAVESSPPLFYVLAWAAGKVSDPTVWIRLPSLVFGVATVPLVFALSRRVTGREVVGFTAAALVAVGPFAIFFSTEARSYATLAFFVSASTLALLKALESGRIGWWTTYGLASTAALYSHYTAAFPLVAQAGWAAWTHREHVRPLVVVNVATGAAFAPWLPEIRDNGAAAAIAGSYHVDAGSAVTALLRVLWGHPLQRLSELPGTTALVALAVVGVLGVGGLMARLRRFRRHRDPASPDVSLIAILAGAVPVGLLLYWLLSGSDLYIPRNLTASLPALAILVSLLVWSLPRRLAAAAATLAIAVAGVGAALLFEPEHQRPAFRTIAHEIDAHATPGDRVVDSPLFFTRTPQLQRGLTIQFEHPHRVFRLVGSTRRGGVTLGVADPRAWDGLRRGEHVYVTGFERPGVFLLPEPPPRARLRLVSRQVFAGLAELTLVQYARE